MQNAKFIINNNSVEYVVGDKTLAIVEYPSIDENIVDINHTEVDSSLQGQGIAGKLMEYTYVSIKTTKRMAKLTCSYAIKWYEKNIDKQDILFKE